jgi:hypothetical protein
MACRQPPDRFCKDVMRRVCKLSSVTGDDAPYLEPGKILISEPLVPGAHLGVAHASFWRLMRPKKNLQKF